MPGAVYRRPDQRDLAGTPGGRLILDDGDRLDLVPGICGQLLGDLAGLDTLAPVTWHQVDIQAELPGHLSPQGSEMPSFESQHTVPRRQRVNQRGLPGPSARRGVQSDRPRGAAQPRRAGQHVAGQAGELRTAVIDGRRRHRRSTRSGTLVGPGIWRKCRPLWYVITMS